MGCQKEQVVEKGPITWAVIGNIKDLACRTVSSTG